MAKAVATFGVNPVLLALARRRGPEGERVARLLRNAVTRGALMWHRKLLPGHFKEGAAVKYPGAYTRRAKGYLARKQRKMGHRKPMVFSGQMRDTVLGKMPTIKGRAQGRSLRMEARLAFARAANLWCGTRVTPAGMRHDFHREMTAINRAELEQVRRVIEETAMMLLGDELAGGGRRIKPKRFTA